ncbi:MAG: hypothetical protein ACK4FK_05585 [Ferrovibrio sp.]|uniref:hypothetical protein n=1 Tax=Ferrovibrio sp. TaxID=1917215 RepID=UPI0039198915
MQTIAPVVADLISSGLAEIVAYATRDSWSVICESAALVTRLDELAFSTDPRGYIGSLFDRHQPDLILSGSSPARNRPPETPEQYAIIEARCRHLPSVGVLDYWGMYTERFSRDGHNLAEDLLPDCLCVLDSRSWDDLKRFGVPAERMTITHNPWLDTLASQSSAAAPAMPTEPRKQSMTVLLASQPLAEMQRVRNLYYNQYTIFECLLAAMQKLKGLQPESVIQVLAHPSEEISRWENRLASKPYGNVKVQLLSHHTPSLLREADYLVTSHSTLAYEALYFGTPCISLRPSVKPTTRLWIDESGLSRVFQDVDSLAHYFRTNEPTVERQRVLRLKHELTQSGLFFSDGQATRRVAGEVVRMLSAATRMFA